MADLAGNQLVFTNLRCCEQHSYMLWHQKVSKYPGKVPNGSRIKYPQGPMFFTIFPIKSVRFSYPSILRNKLAGCNILIKYCFSLAPQNHPAKTKLKHLAAGLKSSSFIIKSHQPFLPLEAMLDRHVEWRKGVEDGEKGTSVRQIDAHFMYWKVTQNRVCFEQEPWCKLHARSWLCGYIRIFQNFSIHLRTNNHEIGSPLWPGSSPKMPWWLPSCWGPETTVNDAHILPQLCPTHWPRGWHKVAMAPAIRPK